ncbi:MAG: hypothetical protein K8W52_20985 [Deltaproteobacteria bacterium]|nr:hypothetical protein [Deltaproteobacteria bacterium]
MKRLLVIAVLIGACRDEPPLHKLPAPRHEEPTAIPPPSPGPRADKHRGPPHELAEFVRAHDADPGAWEITFADLDPLAHDDGPYAGYAPRHTVPVPPAIARALIARLASDDSYQDAIHACEGFLLGIQLRRGPATFTFLVECGDVFIPDPRQPGAAAVFNPAMIAFLDEARRAAGL